jgi:hypothetical protein
MANSKISALTGATTPLDGTEVLPIIQSGSTKKVANNDLRPKQIQSNATSGVLQITGPAAASTRVATVPDANWTAARTDAAQSFTGDQTLATGNVVQGTAAKGFNFTANTPAAGMTSRLLNWYEEGAWTAGITFGGGSTGLILAASTGLYTRVGNIVHLSIYILFTAKGTSTGAVLITGLPFTINSATGAYSAPSLYFSSITFSGQVVGYGAVNTKTIALTQTTTAGVSSALTNTNFANDTGIIMNFTYRV